MSSFDTHLHAFMWKEFISELGIGCFAAVLPTGGGYFAAALRLYSFSWSSHSLRPILKCILYMQIVVKPVGLHRIGNGFACGYIAIPHS